MSVQVVVPQIGEAVSELTLVAWHKRVGDSVQPGEVLFEIDSDKAIVEIEAFVAGTLAQILHGDGSSVMPLQVVAVIEPVGANLEAIPVPAVATPVAEASPKVSPVAQRLAAELNVDLRALSGSGPGGRITSEDVRRHAEKPAPQPANGHSRVIATPKAKRLARELALDLHVVAGTGIGGMIRALDVERAAQVQIPTPEPKIVTDDRLIPLTKLRQVIAERTARSKQEIPHFYLMADVNMAQAAALRAYCKDHLGWERPPTYTDLIVRACALALRDLPGVNRSFAHKGLIAHDRANIGVAVGTDDGLVVPVVADADMLNLRDTSSRLRDLAERARLGRLRPADLEQKSMVVSNLGMYGVDAFVAIIDLPDPMILAVGRVAERVVPLNGQVAIQPMCTLTLSVDHRVLDGVQGAQFLERVKLQMEQPFDILGAS